MGRGVPWPIYPQNFYLHQIRGCMTRFLLLSLVFLAVSAQTSPLASVQAELRAITAEVDEVQAHNVRLKTRSRLPDWVMVAVGKVEAAAKAALAESQLIVIAGPPKPPPPVGSLPATPQFYVRTDGHDTNCNGTANASSASAPNCAWLTINYACDTLTAGDTGRVQAGTYVETASCSVSGTSGNTVTLVADGAVTTCGMGFSGQSYVRVIGFTMNGATGGCTQTNPRISITGTNTGLEFWNNTLTNTNASSGNSAFDMGAADRCHACIIVGGSVTDVTINGYGIEIAGNDILMAYVAFDEVAYIGVASSGSRMRFLNLKFTDMRSYLGSHPDFFYPQGGNDFGYSYNLIESTYGIGSATEGHNKTVHYENDTPGGVAWTDNIHRLNVSSTMGSGHYSFYSGFGTSASTIDRFRSYHETVYKGSQAQDQGDSQYANCGNFSTQYGVISASIFNNIYVQCWTEAARTGTVYGWAVGYSNPPYYDATITHNYNAMYDTRGNIGANGNGDANGQTNVDPSFTNAGTNDLSLQSGSALRGDGGKLTTAVGAGSSSTSLTVTSGDGSMFVGSNAANLTQYSGALVPGDFITVDAATAQIASISGDVITLVSAISWDNGDPVYFGSSATIDPGAYPYKASYALSATYAGSGTITITPNDASLVRFVVCYESGAPYAVDNSSPYTCATPAGTFSATVYPKYASATLGVAATP
jgi:hypothetical protein